LIQITGNKNKLFSLDVFLTNEERCEIAIKGIGMWGFATTVYTFLDLGLLATFLKRWHGKTNNFHIPSHYKKIVL
jgi:hypothetical protein